MSESDAVDERPVVARDRGRAAVIRSRTRPEPGAGTELSGWFDGGLRRRLLRRVLAQLPARTLLLMTRHERGRALGLEAAFWGGVREAATDAEWRRLTISSYVVLYYHRLSGELKPGQERLDLSPATLAWQLRLLGRLGFRSLTTEQLIAFHDGSLDRLPRRGYVITADDGFADCVEPFLQHAGAAPQLFVCSDEVGGRSWWAGDEPLAAWEDLRCLAEVGVGIGSHAHTHVPLDELDDAALHEQLVAARSDLMQHLPRAIPVLAYPHGRRDDRVVATARAAGFRLAYTTDPGRNGSGTDPMQLRRVGVKAWDSRLSFLFKVLTGELLPPRWEERRIKRGLPEYHRRRSTMTPIDG